DGDTLTFLYTDHHDAAYEWVGRRRFLRVGDALRVVLIPEGQAETSTDNKLPPVVTKLSESGELAGHSREVSRLGTDDDVLEFLERVPLAAEQKEVVLERVLLKSRDYRLLPELQVYVVLDDADLQAALEYPLDLWRVFLHPKQRDVVERSAEESLV